MSQAEAERPSVARLKQGQKEMSSLADQTKANLSAIFQKTLAIETERKQRFRDRKAVLSDEYEAIRAKVTDGFEKNENKWGEIMKLTTPLGIEKSIELMRSNMDQIIKHKLDFIKELEDEVLLRDHEYVNKIFSQTEQIRFFVKQMRSLEDNFHAASEKEQAEIISAFETERSNLILQIDKDVKQISAKRQEKEANLEKRTLDTAISQRNEMESIRQQYNQEYVQLRANLELCLQNAQKEHEDRLAQYHYSLEQLEYDYQILQENKDEHEEKIKLQANKLVRQREILRRLRRKYHDQDAQFAKQNADITRDYDRIALGYRDLQSRFRNVAFTDFNNFREVWNLNEKDLHTQILKIIEADRVVREQELGKDPRAIDPIYLKRWIVETQDFEDLTKTPQLPEEGAAKEVVKESVLANKELSPPLEHLRRMICDEIGFIVDERVMGIIGANDEQVNEDSIKLDVLLEELGITTEEDTQLLLGYFMNDTEFGELDNPDFVSPHEVVDALRKFVEAYHPTKQQNQSTLFSQITTDATQNTTSEVARAIMQLQKKMNRQMVKQKDFLVKKSSIITEDVWRLWNLTFKGMQRYIKELEERASLIDRRDQLRSQNQELQGLLSKYLQSKENDELIYPPEKTVDFAEDQ